MKRYGANGLVGCVQQRRAQSTGTLVGIYHAEQAHLGAGPRWAVVCEVHHNVLRCEKFALARAHATDPSGWCEGCRTREEKKL